uniref:Uncharacterized protein n=1 Tax=Zea mays TaxID=4577 RepID=C4IZB7_MAIZE|nr:unknown [Zea mays]
MVWSTSPPKVQNKEGSRWLDLAFASLVFSWQNLYRLRSPLCPPNNHDDHNKYDSTTVRPNFCWTSFGVSIAFKAMKRALITLSGFLDPIIFVLTLLKPAKYSTVSTVLPAADIPLLIGPGQRYIFVFSYLAWIA